MRYRRTLRYEPLENRRLLATLTVTTLADTVDLADGLTSLREAIFATNLVTGPDIIKFSSKLPGIVTLTQGELRITDDLTIRHQGGLITLDALASDPTPTMNNGDGSRIFHVDDGSSTSFIEVTIEGLALVGGDAPLSGGAILNRENLTLSRMHVIGNSASNGDIAVLSNGGGIAHSLGRLVVTDSEIANNAADFGGGIHIESGSLDVDRSVIATNSSVSGSGIYIAAGDAEITTSRIHGNTSGAFSLGGGIYTSGSLRVGSTTISGNTASFGAGVFSRTDAGELTLIYQSTISGNTAFDRGGGVRNAAGSTVIDHSTITGNVAPPGDGGGVASRGYSNALTLVGSSIIAGNTNSDVDFVTGEINTFMSLGYNLVGTGNAIGEFDAPGDRTGIADPLLGPLADNGGPTLPDGSIQLTHALLPGSPAINAGDLNANLPLYDQRGEPFSRVVNGRFDIGAYEFEEPSDLNLVVSNLTDELDGNFSPGNLSLREAAELANQWPSNDTIRFEPSLIATGPATILLKLGELKITDDVTIEGPAAELLTIDASGNDPTPTVDDGKGSRIFNVNDDSADRIAVTISGLRLTGGDVAADGGAITTTEALLLRQLVVEENAAVASRPLGGGIHSTGHVQIESSRIANNLASGRSTSGGAIAAMGGLVLQDSEVTGNRAGRSAVYSRSATTGGATSGNTLIQNTTISANLGLGLEIINADRVTHIIGSTISDNTSSGGVRISTGTGSAVVIRESTISGHDSGSGLNVSGIGVISVEVVNSLIADNTNPNTTGGGANFSIGSAGTVMIDDTAFIENRAFSGGGIAVSGNAQITDSEFRGNVATGTAGNGGAMLLNSGNHEVTGSEIRDNVAGRDGGGIYVTVATSRTVSLFDNTIVSNMAGDLGGGIAIAASGGIAAVLQSNIAENSAAGSGGGIWLRADSQARVKVENSSINFNSAHIGGGGVSMTALGQGEALIKQSTISLNESNGSGGGIALHAVATGRAIIAHSTITENTADANNNGFGLDIGGGITASGSGSLQMANTILGTNLAPLNTSQDFSNLGIASLVISHSLIGNSLGSGVTPSPIGMADVNGNLIGGTTTNHIDPRLGHLANNGGKLMTHALLSNSPAINAGNPTAVAGVGDVPLYDQRGEPLARVFAGRIDMGALEALPNTAAGDYNFDGRVDAADYVLWKSTRFSISDLRADGNSNGIVENADFLVWRSNFGRTVETIGQGAGVDELESNAIVPKPPASPAGDLGAASDPWADTSFTTARRRTVGSRLVEAVSLNSTAQSEDSVLAALVPLRTSDDEWSDFSPRRDDSSRGFEGEISDARASVLDCVFDALGGW